MNDKDKKPSGLILGPHQIGVTSIIKKAIDGNGNPLFEGDVPKTPRKDMRYLLRLQEGHIQKLFELTKAFNTYLDTNPSEDAIPGKIFKLDEEYLKWLRTTEIPFENFKDALMKKFEILLEIRKITIDKAKIIQPNE